MRFGFLLKILSLSAPDNFHSYFVKELEKLCLDFLNKKASLSTFVAFSFVLIIFTQDYYYRAASKDFPHWL